MPVVGWAIVLAVVVIFTTVIVNKNKQLKSEKAVKA